MKLFGPLGFVSKNSISSRPSIVAAIPLVLLLGTFSPSPAAGEPLFAAPSLGFKVGGPPEYMAAGDLDLDGVQDLVTGGTVSVLLGNGDGTFGENSDYGAGRGPLAIGDLNGDGNPDLTLVIFNYPEPQRVSVMLGNGGGKLGPKTDVATLVSSYDAFLAMADLNADGKLDLAVSITDTDFAGTVSVLLGNGDGTFSIPRVYSTGNSSKSLAIADLNGDGNLDLAVANAGANTVSVLLGNGDGTFGVKSDYGTGGQAFSVAIGDLNADGKLDLAVANHGGYTIPPQPGSVSVLLGNGDGTFGLKSVVGPSASSVAIADLNRDGKPDLMSGFVLLGNGNGTFGPPIRGGGQLVGDLNGDGNVDVVNGSGLIPFVSVALGNGDGTFGGKGLSYEGAAYTELVPNVAIGDLNGDGKPDLATPNASLDVPGTVSVVLGHGDGTFGPNVEYATEFFSTSAAIGDLNGDGKQDMVVSGVDHVSVLLGNGDGTLGPKSDFEVGSEPHFVAIGDLNTDGNLDVVTANYSPSTVSVLLGNGDGTFRPRIDFADGNYAASLAIGDLNGDAKPDLAITSGACCLSTISVLIGNGDGTFRPRSDVEAGYIPKSVAMGDLNRDGKQDLVTVSTAGNRIWVLMGNGDGTFAAPTYHGANLAGAGGEGGQLVAIGDLDGDVKPDLAVTCAACAGVFVLLGNGDGTFEGNIVYAAHGGAVAIGDLNGDAKPDLVTLHEVLLNISPDPIAAEVSIHPRTLQLNSREKLVTGTVRVPAPYDASQIDVSSIRLNGVVAVSTARPPRVEGNGRVLAVAFEWAEVKRTLAPGRDVPVTITGTVAGKRFSGTDHINVSERGAQLVTSDELAMPEPAAVERVAFALHPVNPAGDGLVVRFGLPSSEPAMLTAYDVTGRRVAKREVGSSGPGWRTMRLGDLPAGLYLVRLSQAGRSLTARVAVVH